MTNSTDTLQHPRLTEYVVTKFLNLHRTTSVKSAKDYLAKALGVSKSQKNEWARKILAAAGLPAGHAAGDDLPKGEPMSDTYDVQVHQCKAKTLEEVVELCGVDTDKWEPRGFSVRGGKAGFGWNARFSKKIEPAKQEIIEDLKNDLKSYVPTYKPTKHTLKEDGRLLVVSLFDAHLGKLNWSEQGGQNYDLKIAKEVFLRALHDLIAKAKKQGNISRILFPVGNDYMTCDGDDNETSAGTPQSVDGRFPKIFREARKLLVEAIDELRLVAPVDVVVIPGNHERESMFHLGDALECWYHADKDVTIDNLSNVRKYYAFGETMFGLTHGDTIKQDQLPLLGAVERPDLWAKCKRRAWFLGHFHHYQLKEYVGVQVWILPSLSGTDGYHQSNGYVGAGQCAVALMYSNKGLETMFQSELEN